jgi:transcriptional regulator with XRE-family HTH domain
MNNVGEKIRGIRTLKGLSQQNMADVLGLSLPTYADIERGKKDVTISRLETIAKELGVTLNDIMNFNDRISNFFDQCNNANVSTGSVNGSNQTNNYDARELQHQIEKLQLEMKLLQAEKDKAEMEARYWREKSNESKKS